MNNFNKRGGKPNPGGNFKKFKAEEDEDEFGMDFDSEDVNMDVDLDQEALQGQGPETESTNRKWSRPAAPVLNPAEDGVVFQQIDIDHYVGQAFHGMPGPQSGPVSIMRMYGVTMEGVSVCCHVHGFVPYLYISAPKGFNDTHIRPFLEALDKAVLADMRSNKLNLETAILDVSLVKKKSIMYYTGDELSTFIQIRIALPQLIAAVQRILRKQIVYDEFDFQDCKAFEGNIDFDIRFMVDTGIYGCSWIELKENTYSVRSKTSQPSCESRCQYEVDVAWDKFIAHKPEGIWAKVAPFRILSFDIECAGRKGIFPEPDKDPVIQIANVIVEQGTDKIITKNVFTLNTCAPIVGTHVISCKKESELLERWADFIRESDPDILTGYNINNFDIPYLINRAKHLKANNFEFLGRIKNIKSVIKNTVIQSKQMGKRENKYVNFEGRVPFDLLFIILREYKLRSYTLNYVSYHFLNEQKEDVHHSIITDLQNGDEYTRKRLAVYCVKDALLPIQLIKKLMCFINYMEMARVTGVPLECLLTRGQQIKVVSQLLRKAKEKGFLMPANEISGQDDQFEGATVIEPKRGYYKNPIATLDFASLYPSIMMAHNLCYTTLVPPNLVSKINIPSSDITITPLKNHFVKSNVRKGLLPEILESLLAARKKAKEDLKKETDPLARCVLDGRQLALKISANSVYGFTGAQVGKLPCLEISGSVTSYGREMIELTKNEVEQKYKIENGYPSNAVVIYGDTDSVMVNFGVADLKQAMDLGSEAAQFVSGKFIKPIKLEFEKVYYPYLLINKKRYAGLYYTKVETYDKMDCKGIETVRRDNSPLVANLLNTSLQKLLIEKDPDGAIEYVKETISDLLNNRVDISQLVITKELSKEDYAAKQAHVELANKMKKRDPGTAPKLGDRVPFIITAAAKGTPAYMKAEDPIYVLENSIPIDCQYYLENQLSKPLLRIFEPILGDKAESILLRGDHTRTRTIASSKVGGLAAFTKKRATCIGCKTVLPTAIEHRALCDHCKANESQLYQQELRDFRDLEDKFCRLWSECQRCQGSHHMEVICTSRDCPIFYMRKKVRLDLEAKEARLKKFGVPSW